MRQRRWLELLKNYDCDILYRPGKANVVSNALNRKSIGMVSYMMVQEWNLMEKFSEMSLRVEPSDDCLIASLRIEPSLVDQIRQAQRQDPDFMILASQVEQGLSTDHTVSEDGILRYRGRICVSKDDTL